MGFTSTSLSLLFAGAGGSASCAVSGLEFRVWGLGRSGLRVWAFGAQGLGVQGSGLGLSGLRVLSPERLSVQSSEFGVWDSAFQDCLDWRLRNRLRVLEMVDTGLGNDAWGGWVWGLGSSPALLS